MMEIGLIILIVNIFKLFIKIFFIFLDGKGFYTDETGKRREGEFDHGRRIKWLDDERFI